MPGARCDHCGVEEYMPYVCKFCKGRFCAAHRLPENHKCQGLDAYRERLRQEGRVYVAPDEEPVRATVSTPARDRARASMDAFWARVDGKMTWIILGVCLAVYLLEWAVAISARGLFDDLFVLSNDVLTRPWTVVTSIFAHAIVDEFGNVYISHLLFNMLALVFFGATVERLLGTRRFTGLFLVAGIVAGLAQIVVVNLILGRSSGALGASGALQGVMGALVVLAPTLTVLVFFVVPAPLWALVALFVVIDLVGALGPGDNIAHIAHLAGLAVGIGYGYYLRKQGLRAVVRRAPPMWSR